MAISVSMLVQNVFRPLDAVIFDLDGVLIDSDANWAHAQRKAFKAHGILLTEPQIQSARGRKTSDFVLSILSEHDDMANRVELIAEEILKNIAETSDTAPHKPGAVDAIRSFFDKGVMLGLCTSSPQTKAMAALETLDPDSLINFVQAADSSIAGKPNAAPYTACAKGLGFKPENCLVFEDSVAGITSALAAGMNVIAIGPKNALPSSLLARCLLRLNDLSGLTPRMIKSLIKTGGKTFSTSQLEHPSAMDALRVLYDNKQQWVRHYETSLARIPPLSTTGALSIAAYVLNSDPGTGLGASILSIAVIMTAFTLWFVWWCDQEIARQFDQIVSAETGMNFFDYWIDGNPVLPGIYEESGVRKRPIVVAGYALQVLSLIVLTSVAFIELPFDEWINRLGTLEAESVWARASDAVGYCGVSIVISTYILVQSDKMAANRPTYQVLNMIACALILYSLYFNPNLPSSVIQVLWLSISLFGLLRYVFLRRSRT